VIELYVPSKTFVVGEYAVLRGAPALVAATKPYFHFTAKKSSTPKESPFHADSPAGKWFRQSQVLLKDWDVKFTDPHEGRGGFGASGAQFVFYHALCTYLQADSRTDDAADIWQDFKVCDSSNGSGADVVAQTLGGITCFTSSPFEAQSSAWPFQKMDFVILRTGRKTETHSHLKSLKLGDTKALLQADELAVAAFLDADLESFLAETATFQNELRLLGLQDPATTELLKKITEMSGVVFAKGCGAMGADTIMAFVEHAEMPAFREELKHNSLEAVATSLDLAAPLKLEMVN
jgi:mevalonate kinase